jgi:hypothetical protein
MWTKVKAVVKFMQTERSSQTKNTPLNSQPSLIMIPNTESIIIDQQQRKKNEEDITIVWLSKDAKNPEKQSLVESLRSINDYVQVRLKEFAKLKYFDFV